MSEVKTRTCPNCGLNLVFEDTSKAVYCEGCDQTISWDSGRLSASSDAASSSALSMAIPAMMGFDNPESGVVFIENFFENYNWIPYMISPDIKVREIAEVVDNNKMKNGACATSWYLDYKALAYPVRKKIEGLAKHQKEMADIYNPVDPTASLALFDSYKRVCRALVKGKKDIFKQLDTAIKYAEKFNLDADKMDEIKGDYEELKSLFNTEVKLVKDISEIPAYIEAKKAASKKIADELAAKGIDAESTYAQALSLYNDSSRQSRIASLALFEKVRGYEDSVRLIKKINQYFNYHQEMYRAFGAHFIYKQEEFKTETLDIKELGKKAKKSKKSKKGSAEDAASPAAVKAWSLFEVVDGKPAKESSIKGIDKIITCYGGRLYYFKKDGGIYSYDITTHAEAVLCKGKLEDFQNAQKEYEYRISTAGNTFFVKKLITKDEEEESGCSKILSKFKKKKVEEEDPLNLYCVVMIDMRNNTCKPLISKLTAVAEAHENKIFYTIREKQKPVKLGCVDKLKGKKAKDPEIITRLMVCDADTGVCKQALDGSCDINAVYKDNIIYTIWKPNALNKDLHSLNLTTGKDTLIERNIYEYFQTNAKNELIDGKLYYTVGNEDYQPLVRNNLEGTERLEIMARVAEVAGERGGYLYIKKGRGVNSTLWKISTDGKERYPLCSQFKKVAKFEDHYVYYVDVYNSLHVMRIDGKENRTLADNVSNVITSTEGLYYTRLEPVAGRKKAFSLYLMDKGGRNVKKVEFNLVSYKEDLNTGIITYARTEKVDFKVYLPKKEDEAAIQTHEITRYYELDKETGETELVLTMGWPEDEDKKKGCLSKIFKPKKHIYEEYHLPQTYECGGLHPDYEDGEENLPNAPQEETVLGANGVFGATQLPAGCNQALEKAGCASIFKAFKSQVNPNNGGKQSAVQTKLPSVKAKAKSASKKLAIKINPVVVALALVALSLFSWAISSMIAAFNWSNGYGRIAVFPQIILPFILALVTGGLAAMCFGIIPVGRIKRNLPLTVLYGVLALIFAVTGIVNITNLPGKGETYDNPYTIELNETETLKIQEYSSTYCEFYASETGAYAFTIAETNASVRLSLNNQVYVLYSGDKAYFTLYAGNYYTFSLSWADYYPTDKVDLIISKAQAGAAASAPIDLKIDTPIEGSIANGQEVWYRFYNDGYHGTDYFLFSLTSNVEVTMYGYSDYVAPSDKWSTPSSNYNSCSSSIVWNDVYVGSYDDFLIMVKATGDAAQYTLNVQLPPTGESADKAFIARENESSTSYHLDYYGYVWYKFTAQNAGEYTFYVNSSNDDDARLTLSAYDSSMASYMKAETPSLAEATAYEPWVSVDMEAGETVWLKVLNLTDYYTNVNIYTASSTNGMDCYRAYTLDFGVPATNAINSDINSVWYKFTAPASDIYTLMVSASDTYNDVYFYLYEHLDEDCLGTSYSGNSSSLTLHAEEGKTYWIQVLSYGYTSFELNATTATIISAEEEVEGSVTNSCREVWYQYTPTESSRQTISVSANTAVDLYIYVDPYSYDYSYNSGSNFNWSYDFELGTTYWIKVYYSAYSDISYTFTITLPIDGSSAQRALTIETSNYWYDRYCSGNLWLKYTANESGYHKFTAKVNYNPITAHLYNNPNNWALDTASGYDVTISYNLTAGETYYFLIENVGYQQYIDYRVSTPENGLTSDTAYTVEVWENNWGEVSYNNSRVWYQFTPTESRYYTISANSDDSWVSLYGYTSNPNYYSYSGYDYGSNPSLYWYLEAGQTYWFEVRYHSGDTSFYLYID